MLTFWRAIYNLLFPAFRLLARVLAWFNPKIRASLQGRVGLFERLSESVQALPQGRKRVWFHAASVGEFEQARPIIAELRKRGDVAIVVSFLSASGYEARKHFPDADLVTYLPEDSPKNAKRFCALVKPNVAVVVRYDFWLNHLAEAKASGAKLVLIAASIQARNNYFKPILKSFYKAVFELFDKIFAVSESDARRFSQGFGLKTVEAAGDTRFDQVFERSKRRTKIARLEAFYRETRVLVCGSTWRIDEELIAEAFLDLERVALIVAPHEVDEAHLRWLESLLNAKGLRYARATKLPEDFSSERVLIIDEIGYLAELYALASVAYVGGGFGANVHNVLEAAAHGVPVVFGGNVQKSREAKELAQAGGAFIATKESLAPTLRRLFERDDERREAGKRAAEFVQRRLGATTKILKSLAETQALQTKIGV
ncbi:MAG: 3-deoxy-D-manno-octulosonic acid transferase [Chloroherpetonaceae bacterium]|nr:3-deoxy-D-manno-octulosonic acid transferase [Chloroherpetonaceae bacterium]MDW8438765.1 glycosyltransferase N-terminal domain-containing protein [Chloroherpetonaceae bacterium]